MYAAAYTAESELSAGTVLPENFSLTPLGGGFSARIKEAYYYPELNQIKLEAEADMELAGASLWHLTGNGVKTAGGANADIAADIYLFSEDAVEYGSTSVSSVTYLKNGVPLSEALGNSGITAVVRVCNTAGTPVSGTLSLYDGDTYIANSAFTADGESFTEVSLNAGAHTFIGEGRVVLTTSN